MISEAEDMMGLFSQRLEQLERTIAGFDAGHLSPDTMTQQRFAQHVLEGQETLKVDLKWNFEIKTDRQKLDFVKDVVALANTRSEDGIRGYLILGCKDARERKNTSFTQPRFSLKVDEVATRDLERQLQQIVEARCDPPPTVTYEERKAGESTYGLLTIHPPPHWPVYVNAGKPEAPTWEVWIRRCPTDPFKAQATKRELADLFVEYAKARQLFSGTINRSILRGRPFNEGVIQYLALSLTDELAEIRMAATRTFREIAGFSTAQREIICQLLIGMLVDRDVGVAWESLRSLSSVGDERAIAPVSALLQNTDDDRVVEAIHTLAKIGNEAVIPELQDLRQICAGKEEILEAIDNCLLVIEARGRTLITSQAQHHVQ